MSTAAQTAPRPVGGRGSYRAGFAFGTLTFIAVAAIGLLSTVVTARVYGVRVIGQYALAWAPVAALWVLSTVKEQQALIREIAQLPPRHPRVTHLFAVVFAFSATLTFAVSALAAALCFWVFPGPLHAPQLLAPALVNVACFALLINTGWNLDSVLAAFVAGRQIFWVRLHEALMFLAVAVAVGLVWRSVWGLVTALVVSSATTLAHRALAARTFVRPRLSRTEFRAGLEVLPDLLRFGLKATPGTIAQGVSQQGGVWALGTIAPVAVVGAYSRAQMVPQRLQQATNRITEVLYPTLVARRAEGDGAGFDRALVDSVRYEMAGMLALAALLGGAAPAVLALFGPGFAEAASALALLALFPALASVTLTQTQALWAVDRPGLTSLIALARMALTLALLVYLTPRLGITGPAVALLVGLVAAGLLSGVALRRYMSAPLRRTWPVRERVALSAAYLAGFLAARVVQSSAPSLAMLPVDLFAGGCAFLAAFLLCGGLNERDRGRLAELRRARCAE